jgi:sugar transferase EpsL
MMSAYRGKRFFDCALLLLLTPVVVPSVCVVGLFVWGTMGRPLFFRHLRAGRNGEPFEMIKFRTMDDRRNASGELLPDEERLGWAGRWLRASSLDELPELLHVWRGQMSLVGPRPLPVAYVSRYTVRQAGRLACRPGLTGLAQVRGRNALGWEERFELDLAYVERQSLWLDMKLLLQTVGVVLSRRGISSPGSATMSEFKGSGGAHPGSRAEPGGSAPAHRSES